MKILKIIFIIIICFATFLIFRKYYALSDQSLMKYGWKCYNLNCIDDSIEIKEKDLTKIGKEWKLTYRWIDNSVFLHINSKNSENDCIYICK